MKWNTIFSDPDIVGQSEYRAIFSCIHDAVENPGPNDELDSEAVGLILSGLEEFDDWVDELRNRIREAMRKEGLIKT